jgi:multidrug resistance efflux pump
MKKLQRYGFYVLWFSAAVSAAVMFYVWEVDANYLGIVESKSHMLGSPERGRIREVLVTVGQQVHADQLLVRLDSGDLEAEAIWIKEELTNLETMVAADRRRYMLEYEKLLYQRDASTMGANQRRADLESKRAELESLDTQIQPLLEAEKAGLGRSRELANLMVRRDALSRYVKEGAAGSLRTSRSPGKAAGSELSESESVVLSMLRRRLDRISDLNLRLKVIEATIQHRNVYAPCDGRVGTINYQKGDVVDKVLTIITLEEAQPSYVDVFLPEGTGVTPRLGDRVAVYSKSAIATKAFGAVESIEPGFSLAPERLWFRNIPFYTRKFRVKLEPNHGLMPSEGTRVELLHNGSQVLPSAHAQEKAASKKALTPPSASSPTSGLQTRTKERLSVIKAPDALREQTVIEPSGIVWLKDINRYVIVSDDTGRGHSKHAPLVLLMDSRGDLQSSTAMLGGVNRVNDLESIAPAPDGTLYLVSSQNLTKKGKRTQPRQQILKVKRSGESFRVISSADFYAALVASYHLDQLRGLGLGETNAEGKLLLNIEGAAFYRGDLLLGVKLPRPATGALILRLSQPERFMERGTLDPGQVTRFAQVNLRTPDGRPAAFSDLAVGDRDELFALSTVPGASDQEQVGGMHRLLPTGGGKYEAVALYAFPGLKPEGLCSLGNDRYTVVFDTDNKPPFYYLTLGVTRS